MKKSFKGLYKPENPKKYVGDVKNIIYRSLLERRMMVYLDNSHNIEHWASEELPIRYYSPIDNKWHRYFPDFWLRVLNADGQIKETLIEIKPKAQTRPPKNTPPKDPKRRRRFIKEVKTWGVNEAKWKAATAYCIDKDWTFKILTESDLKHFN